MVSVSLFFVSAAPLYREFSQRGDIWWTPSAMMVPLAESQDRVEIYARGEPLAALLQAGQVRIEEDHVSSVLTVADVGLRFNNWDRVRAQRLPMLLVSAVGAGIAAFLFILVLTGRLGYRGDRSAV
jgi:hypothetical protein